MSELENPDDPANSTNETTSYMAFISYRHADNTEEDKQWATWLHQQLEVYDIPHELIGSKNKRGGYRTPPTADAARVSRRGLFARQRGFEPGNHRSPGPLAVFGGALFATSGAIQIR